MKKKLDKNISPFEEFLKVTQWGLSFGYVSYGSCITI